MAAVSPRQREVADLVAAGMADKEIARRLGISYKTVRIHMNELFWKLGVRNRTMLALLWSRQ